MIPKRKYDTLAGEEMGWLGSQSWRWCCQSPSPWSVAQNLWKKSKWCKWESQNCAGTQSRTVSLLKKKSYKGFQQAWSHSATSFSWFSVIYWEMLKYLRFQDKIEMSFLLTFLKLFVWNAVFIPDLLLLY